MLRSEFLILLTQIQFIWLEHIKLSTHSLGPTTQERPYSTLHVYVCMPNGDVSHARPAFPPQSESFLHGLNSKLATVFAARFISQLYVVALNNRNGVFDGVLIIKIIINWIYLYKYLTYIYID